MRKTLTSLWMVPYADLMSTLVILFLALFAHSYAGKSPEYSRAVAKLQQEVGAENGSTAAKVRETDFAVKLKEEMTRLRLDEFGVQVTERRVKLVLPEPVLFESGSAALGPQAERVLEPVARLLRELPNPVLLEGHTDDRPVVRLRLRNNWELSAARAYSVAQFLVSQGLAPQRFDVRGYGENRPLAPNDTPEGRSHNRRIELSLVREVVVPEKGG